MSKILIETTGNFELLDLSQQGLVIQADRPTVSGSESTLVSSRAAIGQIKTIATLSDEATDEEFAQYWKDSKTDPVVAKDATDEDRAKAEQEAVKKQRDLAVAAFVDAFSEDGAKEPVKRSNRQAK